MWFLTTLYDFAEFCLGGTVIQVPGKGAPPVTAILQYELPPGWNIASLGSSQLKAGMEPPPEKYRGRLLSLAEMIEMNTIIGGTCPVEPDAVYHVVAQKKRKPEGGWEPYGAALVKADSEFDAINIAGQRGFLKGDIARAFGLCKCCAPPPDEFLDRYVNPQDFAYLSMLMVQPKGVAPS